MSFLDQRQIFQSLIHDMNKNTTFQQSSGQRQCKSQMDIIIGVCKISLFKSFTNEMFYKVRKYQIKIHSSFRVDKKETIEGVKIKQDLREKKPDIRET